MQIDVLFLSVILFVGVSAKPGTRIIGGTDALAGQFPYAAAVQVQTPTSRHFCGGALLRTQFILTSAHCIYNATLMTIQLGSHTLTTDDPNRLTVATSDYYIHPDFDPDTYQADIGIIKLRMNVTLSDYIRTSILLMGPIEEGEEVRILGWGQTSDSDADLSEHLQYVETTVLSTAECQAIYGSQIITDNIICVIGNYNEGTCTGDNGGPLLQDFDGYCLIGVASFISANGCESSYPSGYTNITPYYNWIRSVISGEI